MKRLLLVSFVALGILSFGVASAELFFDPVSPQEPNTYINVDCTLGNVVLVFENETNNTLNFACGSSNDSFHSEGIYTFVECDSTVEESECNDIFATLTLARADSGYVSDSPFTFEYPSISYYYERSDTPYPPGGAEKPYSMVSPFSIRFIYVFFDFPDTLSIKAKAWSLGGDVLSDCFTGGAGITAFNTLPLGDYTKITLDRFSDNGCSVPIETIVSEYNDGNVIFEVVGAIPTPAGGILNVPSGFISTFLGFISDMASGIWGLVALLIGLPLAFWVIKKVIVVVRDK